MPVAEVIMPSPSAGVAGDGFPPDALCLGESCGCQATSGGNSFGQPSVTDFSHCWLCHCPSIFCFLGLCRREGRGNAVWAGGGYFRTAWKGSRQQLPNSDCHCLQLCAEIQYTESMLVLHVRYCLLVSVLFPALLTVENPRFQTVLAGHLDITVFFFFYLIALWMLVLLSLSCYQHCAQKSDQMGNSCLWGEGTDRRQKREEQQGKVSKETCRSTFARSIQLSEVWFLNGKRWMLERGFSQNMVPLSALIPEHVQIALLQRNASFFTSAQVFCSRVWRTSSGSLSVSKWWFGGSLG